MTRIDVPKYDEARRIADEDKHIRLRPKGAMNELIRGQKAARDRQIEERQARFFKQPDPDALTDAEAEAKIARREADAARLASDAAAARQAADDAAARLAEVEGR